MMDRRANRKIRILFLMVWSIVVGISCSDSFRVVDEKTREKGADVRIRDFHRESVTADGHREWYLESEEAYFFGKEHDKSRIVVYKFDLEQYDSKGKSLGVISAKRGEVDYQNQNISLDGDVVFNESAFKSIRAERMKYNMDTKILTSDSPVTIEERGVTTHCTGGVEVDRENNRQVCKSPRGVRHPSGGEAEPGSGGGLDDIFH